MRVDRGQAQSNLKKDTFDLIFFQARGMGLVKLQGIDPQILQNNSRLFLIPLKVNHGDDVGMFKFFKKLCFSFSNVMIRS